MEIQTFAGELRASGCYADFLAHDYEDDPKLREKVEQALQRRLDGHLRRSFRELDLPTYLIEYVQAVKAITVVGAEENRTTTEMPYVVAGPWPRAGEAKEDADRWIAFVWIDASDQVPCTSPDYCVVLDNALGPDGFLDDVLYGVADIRGASGWVMCGRNGSHEWAYPGTPGDRPYDELCDEDGARCPLCEGQLRVKILYGGAQFYDSGDVPWNGSRQRGET